MSNIKIILRISLVYQTAAASALVSFCFISWFHFVCGIGDRLVRPTLQPSQEFSAKVVKSLAKQGPIYIRAVQDVDSWKVYLDCNETGCNMGLFC